MIESTVAAASSTLQAPQIHGKASQRNQLPNLSAARAFALAASSSRFLGGAVVSRECSSRDEMPAISSIAARNDSSLAFDGLLKPVIFRTNCSEAACTSASFAGGSKLKSVLIFRHISIATSGQGHTNILEQPAYGKIDAALTCRTDAAKDGHRAENCVGNYARISAAAHNQRI